MTKLCSIILALVLFVNKSIGQKYEVKNGEVHFFSEAPKELINASTKQIRGIVDINSQTFVFRVDVVSFAGFNSPLQREHFNENYMESNLYPYAVYKGKIIESLDITKEGSYSVRTKGKLQVHGIEQERIIKIQVTIKNGVVQVKSDFVVLLEDHNIKIPRIVTDKLAPGINVSVTATLSPKNI